MSVPDDVDDAFLLAIDAAEAAAVDSNAKRRRLSTSSSPTPATPPAASGPEGSYLAALKGSHSSTWQQQQALTHAHKRPDGTKTLAGGTQAASGACFKCGDPGHWAKECPRSAPSTAGGGGIGGGGYADAGGEVEEKACPCGAGNCLVLTSNTPRNPGRKFYKCPMRDNGGCNFFEWCNTPSPSPGNARSHTVFESETSPMNMPCPCGAGTCLILTAKGGKKLLGSSYVVAQESRMVPAVAFSSGVTINSLEQVHSCKLHHNTKPMLCQAAKIPARGARQHASNVGKKTTGQRTARINLRILILTKVAEH